MTEPEFDTELDPADPAGNPNPERITQDGDEDQ